MEVNFDHYIKIFFLDGNPRNYKKAIDQINKE